MPIHILPDSLSSQISSGEIIEQPASVVKEIIENSIDAGSKNIHIEIEKSGLQSIILKDDGHGIHKKELLLAISHHATSKINSLSDLNTISTFGFRGEALASIRAVSRLTLISCHQSNDIGWKIYSESIIDNQYTILQPIAHPQGTTIIVENLFYNIPLRLKFIKNVKLEFLKICEVLRKIALSHFYINFSLKHNKQLIQKYNAIENKYYKINRLKDVLNNVDIKNMIFLKAKKHNLSLFGWISSPYYSQLLKKIKYCYVNNRYIRNNIMFNAIYSAYNKIKKDKNISFVLYLTIPSNKIYINIHPTKNEIKFYDANEIYSFIYESILYNLEKLKNQFLRNNTLLSKFDIYKKNELNYLEAFYAKFFILISSYFSTKNISHNNQIQIKKNTKLFHLIFV